VGSSQRSDEVHLCYTGSNDNLLCLPTITSDTSMERSVNNEMNDSYQRTNIVGVKESCFSFFQCILTPINTTARRCHHSNGRRRRRRRSHRSPLLVSFFLPQRRFGFGLFLLVFRRLRYSLTCRARRTFFPAPAPPPLPCVPLALAPRENPHQLTL